MGTTCCLLGLLFLIPLLLWLLCGTATSLPYDCESGFAQWETYWSPAQQEFCCATQGRGCTTALPETTPTVPPTPFPTPPPTPPSILRTLGLPTRRSGAAESTIAAALQPHRRCSPSSRQLRCRSGRPILTTAPMVSQIGWRAGQCLKRNGVAESTARAARIKAAAV